MTDIWFMSDLHQEFARDPVEARDPRTVFDPQRHAPASFDVVVIAGDLEVPLTRSLNWIAERFSGVPVIYVPGNHDFFCPPGDAEAYTMVEQIEEGRALAAALGIHLLMDSTVDLSGTRFIGGTLWTDFGISAGHIHAKMSEAQGRNGMNDYRRIKRWSTKHEGKRKRLRPEDTIAAHRVTRNYIEAELARPFDGSRVVVTHHAPHPGSLDPRHTQLNYCYASQLRLILEDEDAPELWLHGHIHRAVDYVAGHTRIVANPRGYQFVKDEQNNGFDPSLVLTPVPRQRLTPTPTDSLARI